MRHLLLKVCQLHFEGQRDAFGFMLDVTNLQLSDRIRQGPLEIDTDSSTTLIEAAVILGGLENGTGAQILLGARSVRLDIELEIEGLGPIGVVRERSADTTLIDAMVGARYWRAFAEHWNFVVRGDIATGDTDFTWNASAIVGRNFGKRGTLLAGYRYMVVEFDDEKDLINPELTLDGPLIGLMFRF